MRTLGERCVSILCGLFLTVATALAQTPPPTDEAARLGAAYRASLVKLAEDYNAALLPLAEQYSQELLQLAKRMADDNNAAGQDAVRKEAQRFKKTLGDEPDAFEAVPELMRENIVEKPEALRLIQEAYVARRTANDLMRNEKTKELAEKLVGALDALQKRLAAEGKAAEADAAKKEATRLRVAMQRQDFATRALRESGAEIRLMPPVPDFAALSKKTAEAPPATRNLTALTLNDLPPAIQAFLLKPLDYDKDWPPPITKWSHEGTGNYAHDFALYKQPGQPDELGIFAYPKTMKAYVRGTIRQGPVSFDNKTLSWKGKAAAWLLKDSRDLVCQVTFRTKRPAVSEAGGPAGCVAVYSTTEGNRLIASMTVPLLTEETSLRMAKHYSYNRMNIAWEGTKRKRGFTIPDHMPMRVVAGVAGFAPGEQADVTIEITDCPQLGDMW
jgi:hypothetical protein